MNKDISQRTRLKRKGLLDKNMIAFLTVHQIIIELVIVISIMGILISMVIKNYNRYVNVAKASHSLSSSFVKSRMDCMVFRALNGTWPKDNAEALTVRLHNSYKEEKDVVFIDGAEIVNGAINIKFTEKHLNGKVLTMRPAVPAKDQLGPVIWLGGDFNSKKDAHNWILIGEDRTDLESRFIPKTFR